jgi:RNA polymerase sigma-70 factor (ECF subfamily)
LAGAASNAYEEEAAMANPRAAPSQPGEAELVRRARAGDREAFRGIMKLGNQRLFRMARAITGDDAEAEDVVQEAYVRGFSALDTFRGEASIFTWLGRIVINEANGRRRKQRTMVGLDEIEIAQGKGAEVVMFPGGETSETPEADVARMQMRRLLESAIDELPPDFRIIFVMREVEGLSIAETSAATGVREETVKTRLHRARRLLRDALSGRIDAATPDAFQFLGARCDRITEAVMARLPR